MAGRARRTEPEIITVWWEDGRRSTSPLRVSVSIVDEISVLHRERRPALSGTPARSFLSGTPSMAYPTGMTSAAPSAIDATRTFRRLAADARPSPDPGGSLFPWEQIFYQLWRCPHAVSSMSADFGRPLDRRHAFVKAGRWAVKQSQCPVCYSPLEIRAVTPCFICGGWSDSVAQFDPAAEFREYRLPQEPILILCRVCELEEFMVPGGWGYQLAPNENPPINALCWMRTVPAPQLSLDKFCPTCKLRRVFLEILANYRAS
jgi:hypothetical protein